MVGDGPGGLHQRSLGHQHQLGVIEPVFLQEGEGASGQLAQLFHALRCQLGYGLPEEDPVPEAGRRRLLSAADSPRCDRLVQIEPRHQARPLEAEEKPLGLAGAGDGLIGSAQVAPDRLFVGKVQALDDIQIRADQAGEECALRDPARHQAQVQGLLARAGKGLECTTPRHGVVLAVAGFGAARVEHQGRQPLGASAQRLVAGDQLLTTQKCCGSEPRQGHSRGQGGRLGGSCGGLLLHRSPEDVPRGRAGELGSGGESGVPRLSATAHDTLAELGLQERQRLLHG